MSDARSGFTLKPNNGSLWENKRKDRAARLLTLMGYVEAAVKEGVENLNDAELDVVDACAHLKRQLSDCPEDDKPDCSGSLNIGGVEYWFDAWRAGTPTGKRYFRVKMGKPKQAGKAPVNSANQPQAAAPTQQPSLPGKDDGDVPF